MLRVRRRCAQTAHISLQSLYFQRAIFRQNFQRALNLSASSKALSSDFPNFRFDFRLRFRPSPSLLRFGEAVFTEGRRKPQEQKTQVVTFFSFFLFFMQNLGVGASNGTRDPHFPQDNFQIRRRLGPVFTDLCCFAAKDSTMRGQVRTNTTRIPGESRPSHPAGAKLQLDEGHISLNMLSYSQGRPTRCHI